MSDVTHITILQCIYIAILLNPARAATNSIERNDPRLPVHGTKNWERLDGDKFSPRHSHATCVFECPDGSNEPCIWLTGGYSESHRTFDAVILENENSDVWWSRDGARWNQVTELYGDFLQGVGNGDALVGGYVAPWYSRYGHSLNALDGDADGISDVMVLGKEDVPCPLVNHLFYGDLTQSSSGWGEYHSYHSPMDEIATETTFFH